MPYVPSTLKWVLNDNRIEKILINSNFSLEGYIKTDQTKVSWIFLIYVMPFIRVIFFGNRPVIISADPYVMLKTFASPS